MSCKKESTSTGNPSSSNTTTSIASTSSVTGANGNKPYIVYDYIPYNVGGVRNWYALNDLLKMSYTDVNEAVSSNMVIQLRAADINPKGLFLNPNTGFDAQELRKTCSKEAIQANIKVNPRNTKDITEADDLYFIL